MTQADIMDYLDKHPDKLFTFKKLYSELKDKMNVRTLRRSLTKIVKRNEYVCVVRYSDRTEHLTTMYGRRRE